MLSPTHRVFLIWFFAVVLAASLPVPTSMGQGCSGRWITGPDSASPTLNDTVYASLLWDPDGTGPASRRLVLGGIINSAGPFAVSNIVMWDPTTQYWYPLGAGLNAPVRALAVLPNGQLVAGGDFTQSGTTAVNHIAIWNGVRWDPLAQGLNQAVRSLAVDRQGGLVAAGDFTSSGDQPISRVAKWNGSAWLPLGSGVTGTVRAMAVTGGNDLIVAGDFLSAGNTTVNRIAKWDGVSWTGLGSGVGGTGSPSVRCLVISPVGDLYAGGTFSTAGTTDASRVARWDGTTWRAVGPGFVPGVAGTSVEAMIWLPNGNLLVTGLFNRVRGAAPGMSTISNWYAQFDGTYWVAQPVADYQPAYSYTLTILEDGRIAAAGGPGVYGPLNLSGGDHWAPPTGTGVDGSIYAMVRMPDGSVLMGGTFTHAGGVGCSLARWTGSGWRPFGPAFINSGGRTAIRGIQQLQNGDIVVGGAFTSVGTVQASNVARWDGAVWTPLGTGITSAAAEPIGVMCMAPNGDLIVGGSFSAAGGSPAVNIARWNGSAWLPYGPGLPGTVRELFVHPDGGLYVGGAFPDAVARWNGTTWVRVGRGLQLGADLSGAFVSGLAALPNGNLIAGGGFDLSGTTALRDIAQWDGSSWSPMGALFGTPSSLDGVLCVRVFSGGEVLAGGSDTSSNVGLARWNGTSWVPFAGLQGEISDVTVLPSGEVLAIGTNQLADGRPSKGMVRWSPDNVPWIAAQPQSAEQSCGQPATFRVTPASGYDGLTFQWLHNGTIVDPSTNPTAASSTLVLAAVGLVDQGEYRCRVSNGCGQVVSEAASLNVTACCAADFNADGTLNADDLSDFITCYFDTPPCGGADFNTDGNVDPDDLSDFITSYFQGCP